MLTYRKVFAIFLIFLVVNTDLCRAKALGKPLTKVIAEDGEQPVEKTKQVLQKRSGRQRRVAIGAVLFGIALFASVANIALDVYLSERGCCDLTNACTYEREYEASMDRINTTRTNIDTTWLLSTNLLTYIQSTSNKNEEIALELKRISESYDTIIQGVDTETINKYNNMSYELQQKIEENNETILALTLTEVNFEYQSLFSTELGRLQVLSGLIGGVAGGVLAWSWNYYKTAKIQTMLQTSYGTQMTNANNAKFFKVVGAGDNMNNFVKETAVARRSADISYSKGAKAMTIASSILMLLQIGVEIYSAIMKIQQCDDIEDAIKEARDDAVAVETNTTILWNEVSENYDNMTITWNYILGELRDEDFKGYMLQIQNMSAEADIQTTQTINAQADIQTFLDGIDSTSDMKSVLELQTLLVEALENTTYTLTCLEDKTLVYAECVKDCKSGSENLTDIFTTAVNAYQANRDDCVQDGNPYTTYDSVLSYIEEQAAIDGDWSSDCPLNNDALASLVCSSKCNGFNNTQIATDNNISEGYVQKYLDLACPDGCPLTPLIEALICLDKSGGSTRDAVVSKYSLLNYNAEDVGTSYDSAGTCDLSALG